MKSHRLDCTASTGQYEPFELIGKKKKNNEEQHKLPFIKLFINAHFIIKIFYFAKLQVLSNTTIKIALIFLKRKHFLYYEPSYGRNTCTSLASDAD